MTCAHSTPGGPMSVSGATPKVTRKILSRRSNQGATISAGERETSAAAKYELRDPATSRAAELNIMSATLGPDVLDISHLARDLGVFTYDPGFTATASTESKITYIDGDAGLLLYRGYPVEQLAERSSFLEVARLLVHGELPTSSELDAFRGSVMRHSAVNPRILQIFQGFQRSAHPMAMVSAVVASMAAYYHAT